MLLCLNDSTADEPLLPAKDKNLVLADLSMGFIRGGNSTSSSMYNAFILLAFTDRSSLSGIVVKSVQGW